MFCTQYAYSVVSPVMISDPKMNGFVYSASAYQPINVYPSFTLSSGRASVLPLITRTDAISLPPFSSNSTRYAVRFKNRISELL